MQDCESVLHFFQLQEIFRSGDQAAGSAFFAGYAGCSQPLIRSPPWAAMTAGTRQAGSAQRMAGSGLRGHPLPLAPSLPSAKRPEPGAQRRHQPTGARGEAGAHTARQGPEGAQRQRSRPPTSGEARRAAETRNDCDRREQGPGASPLPPASNHRIRGAAPASPTRGRGAGAREGDGGGKGTSRRAKGAQTPPTRPKPRREAQRPTATREGAGAKRAPGSREPRSARSSGTGLIIRSRSKASGFAGNGATDERSETERPRQPASRAAAQQDATETAAAQGGQRAPA